MSRRVLSVGPMPDPVFVVPDPGQRLDVDARLLPERSSALLVPLSSPRETKMFLPVDDLAQRRDASCMPPMPAGWTSARR